MISLMQSRQRGEAIRFTSEVIFFQVFFDIREIAEKDWEICL
jgi:hypothetical protein